MKAKKWIVLLAAALLVLTLTPRSVLAAGGPPALVAESAPLGADNNTENAATLYYGGFTWRVIGYDGSAGRVTLLGAGNLDSADYDSSGYYRNLYSYSTLKTKTDAIADRFASGEQKAVIRRDLAGGSANYNETGYDPDKVRGVTVKDARLWPLSVTEAENVALSLRIVDPEHTGWASSYWWLRTPGAHLNGTIYAASIVQGDGAVSRYGLNVGNARGVRPAFYLNMKSVLFTSAAAGGKACGTVGADALSAVREYTGSEWKVTLTDEDRSGFKIDLCETVYDADTRTVIVPYYGARTGDQEYISAIIKDRNGAITYYGRVALAEERGIAKIGLARKFNDGDKLYLFNEQYNDDYKTDYASPLREVPTTSAGHRWAFSGFTWTGNETEGYTAATANYTCQIDESHTTAKAAVLSATVTAPTCTEGGKTTYIAKIAAADSPDGQDHASDPMDAKAEAATGHTPGGEVEENATAPTCTEAGSHDVVVYCTVCEAELSRETVIDEALGHTPGGEVEENATAPTCTEAGSHDVVVYCTVCEAEVSRETVTDEAIGHNWGAWTVVKEATYTEKGTEQRVCSNDPAHVETHELPKLDRIDLAEAEVTLAQTDTVYTGKAIKPAVTVRMDGETLKSGTDYTVTYQNNTNAGTATVTVTGKDKYTGTKNVTFTIARAEQTISVSAAASVTVGKTTAVTVTGAKGTLSYKSNKTAVAAVDAGGKVTGKKAGTAVITVTAAATANYKQAVAKVTIKVTAQKAFPFKDVTKTDDCYDAVYWAYFAGIVKGKATDRYAPADSLTRGEFCTMLWRMWGKPAVTAADVEKMPFADAKKSNHHDGIAWCYKKGIINGYEDGTFKPSRTLSRSNIIVMLFKLARKEAGYKAPTIKNPYSDVKDNNKNISAYKWAYENKLVTVKKLRSAAPCTRAEMAIFLFAYNNAYNGK